jgi:peptidoglycan/LPS O-acetylase OafA/YrhL
MLDQSVPTFRVVTPTADGDAGMQPAAASRHYPELDALRGIAALVVVFGHFAHLWNTAAVNALPLAALRRLLIDGSGAAVILFFLLSGFVLSLPYKRGRSSPYSTFALRRIARIYIPYLAAVVLAVVCYWRVGGELPLSDWFNHTWTAPLTWRLVLSNILLLGNYDTAQVNTAFWSLAVEMRLSLLFPLICIPLLKWKRGHVAGFVWFVAMLDVVVSHPLYHYLDPVTFENATDMTLGLTCFAVGIVLSRYFELLQSRWARSTSTSRWLFFLVSMVLLEFSAMVGHLHHVGFAANMLQITGGAGVLVSVLFSGGIQRILHHRLPAFFGRISYSLYLVHGTALFLLAHLLFGHYTRMQMLVPYLVLAIGAAALFYRFIENPAILLSRSVGRAPAKVSLPAYQSQRSTPAIDGTRLV